MKTIASLGLQWVGNPSGVCALSLLKYRFNKRESPKALISDCCIQTHAVAVSMVRTADPHRLWVQQALAFLQNVVHEVFTLVKRLMVAVPQTLVVVVVRVTGCASVPWQLTELAVLSNF